MTYSTFTFDRYAWDPDTRTIRLSYSLDNDVRFTEVITLPPTPLVRGNGNIATLNKALFALHLIGGISYYKTFCPRDIIIRSGELNLADRTFWQTVYQNGLGEFFFRNKIDFRGLINFPFQTPGTKKPKPVAAPVQGQEMAPTVAATPVAPKHEGKPVCLVPIGGGKDSMVTIERLKASGFKPILFRLGSHPIIEQLATLSDCPMITVKRQLAPELFALNTKGALNGHVPITAFMHCLTLVLAELYGFDAVVFSDERSANIGSVEYMGLHINHQWSKSLEFERLFQAYAKHSVGSFVEMFSLLRPWSELRITKEFCNLKPYVGVATSCNKNWKISEKLDHNTSRWCGTCPKCVFVFAMMSAYTDRKTLTKIFGKDLYADDKLIPLFKELLGMESIKPFECVGTPEETAAAMYLALQRGDANDTPVMQMFKIEHLPTLKNIEQLVQDSLSSSTEHAIPAAFQACVL